MRKAAYSIGFLCAALLISTGFYLSYHYRDTKDLDSEEEVLEADYDLSVDSDLAAGICTAV